MPCELVRRHIPSCSSKFDVKMENLEILDVGDYNISETIATTETWVATFGSVTFAVGQSENETRISLTVSEIFDRKQEPWTRYFFILIFIIKAVRSAFLILLERIWFLYSSSLFFFFFFPTNSLATYLLLQEWSDPGNFDIISKLGIGRREFLILAGKFQLVDSPWGEQVPHYKHRRRSIKYLLREIPVKTERDGTGVNKRENSRG